MKDIIASLSVEWATVILALLAIAVSVGLWFWSQKKKKLSYDISSHVRLLSIQEEESIKGRIKLLFDNNPIKNVHLFVIKITNNGNIPITPKDFESPLIFNFGKSAKILSSEIIDHTPDNLNPKIRQGEEPSNTLTLEPMLLNQKDSMEIKILVSDYDDHAEVQARARIVGVKEIEKYTERGKADILITTIEFTCNCMFFFCGAILITYGIVGIYTGFFIKENDYNVGVLFSIFIVAGLAGCAPALVRLASLLLLKK